MNRTKKALCAALLPAVILVAGCSPEAVPGPAPSGPSASATSSAEPTPPSGAPSESKPVLDNLKKSPLRRTFQSAGLKVTVEYSTMPSIDQWTASGAKSVRLFMTAVNPRQPSRKIFLTRATLLVTPSDGHGDIPGPEPVVDSSAISPGYLVTSPYSYNQSFLIPPLDDAAVDAVLSFKFETVTLVDPKAKDYTKQTASDTVRLTIKQ